MGLTPGTAEDKDVRELLIEILMALRLLRLAMVLRGTAVDLGDRSQLEAEVDPTWIEGEE